jgi:hypothetical protein
MSLYTLLAVAIATTITLTPIVVTLLTGTLIPILVGLVTRSGASPGLKQAITIVLAGAAALIVQSTLADGSAVFSLETLILAAANWLVAIATYAGFFRSLNINDHLAPTRGLGPVTEDLRLRGKHDGGPPPFAAG